MKLIISSGGTGGHFYPGLSIAREVVSQGGSVVFLVSGQQASDQRAIAESYGLQVRTIPSVRMPRNPWQLLLFPFRFLACCRAIRKIYRELDADALLSMGSFTSVAPCWSWPRGRKPLILHEGNTFMGQANRVFAKDAAAIALTLPLCNPSQLKGRPSRIAGMPLREELLEAAKTGLSEEERDGILAEFGLSGHRRTLLVFGGSQGARAIISLLTSTLPLMKALAPRLQLIVLTGSDDNSALEDACRESGIPARIVKKDLAIQRCYQVADAVLCRAGASSICELALFRKTAMLMPLPTAKDNHQFYNAKTLADAGAARLLVQSETTPDVLAKVIEDWVDGTGAWSALGEKIGDFAHPDATREVVRLINDAIAGRIDS